MGVLLESGLPCPLTGCSSSDAYAHYQNEKGEVWGQCFSCGGHRLETPPAAAITTCSSTWVMRGDTSRKIPESICQLFGVETGVGKEYRATAKRYPYYKNGELTGHKYRELPKKFWSEGDVAHADPFGWEVAKKAGSKMLYIVEGEEDVLAAVHAVLSFQMGGKYAGSRPSVITSGSGVGTLQALPAFVSEYPGKWQGVVLMLDRDEAAGKVEDGLAGMFDLPVFICKLDPTLKDASGYLQAGRGPELARLMLFGCVPWTPVGLVVGKSSTTQELPALIKPFIIGPLNAKLIGYREGMLVGMGAGAGAGKSSVLANEIAGWLTAGYPVASFFLEDSEVEQASKVAGVLLKEDIIGRGSPPTDTQRQAIDWVLEHTARLTNGLALTFDELQSHIRFLHYRHGFRVFIVDPLTVLFDGGAGKINEELNKSLNSLALFVQHTRSVILYTSHLNPAKFGPPHDEGGAVKMDQFTGSRAMTRYSHIILGIERNLHASTDLERDLVTFRVLKNRWGKKLGTVLTQYNPVTGCFMGVGESVAKIQQGVPS